jgi:hypothetical protein
LRSAAVQARCRRRGLYAETDRLQKLADDLSDRIMVTPAETLAGILAKLEVGYDDAGRCPVDDDDPEKDPDQVIIGTAIADLRRWLGGAVMSADDDSSA